MILRKTPLKVYSNLKLMVSRKPGQAWENQSISCWTSCSVCAVTAASSAKIMSPMVVLQILVFALSLVMLYSLPSALVCMYTPSVEVPKACLRRGRRRCQRVSGQGHAALVLIGCVHVIVERSNHTEQIWGASDPQEDVEKPIPANQAKCLG